MRIVFACPYLSQANYAHSPGAILNAPVLVGLPLAGLAFKRAGRTFFQASLTDAIEENLPSSLVCLPINFGLMKSPGRDHIVI